MIHLFDFITTVSNSVCLADYAGLIKEKCINHEYDNVIFNPCTAAIIGSGIAIVADNVFGRSHHQATDSAHSNQNTNHPSETNPTEPAPDYDNVLRDNLPDDFKAVEDKPQHSNDLSQIFE